MTKAERNATIAYFCNNLVVSELTDTSCFIDLAIEALRAYKCEDEDRDSDNDLREQAARAEEKVKNAMMRRL